MRGICLRPTLADACRIKGEVIQPGDQLERRSRYIVLGRVIDLKVARRRHALPRLGRHRAGHPDRAALNRVARPRPARKQPAPDEEFVEAKPACFLEFRIHRAFLTNAPDKRKRRQKVMMRETLHMGAPPSASGRLACAANRAVSMPIEPVVIRSMAATIAGSESCENGPRRSPIFFATIAITACSSLRS